MSRVKISIVRATSDHVAIIAANARPADVQECAAMGKTVAQSLHEGLSLTSNALVGLVNGTPACMFGLASHESGWGVPWLLGTDLMVCRPTRFLRRARTFVDQWRQERPLLNYVDARNAEAIRWLEWLGFDLGEPIPYGNRGEPFRSFTMERQACATPP